MNCPIHPTCYAAECASCVDGRCVVLLDNSFAERKCPFFKTREQVAKEKAYCEQRLRDIRIGK